MTYNDTESDFAIYFYILVFDNLENTDWSAVVH